MTKNNGGSVNESKKIISALCAAAISISALAASVSAGYDNFEKSFEGVRVTGKIEVNSRSISVTSFMKDDPSQYRIFQTKVTVSAVLKSLEDGKKVTRDYPEGGGRWNDNGGYSNTFSPTYGYIFSSATGYFKYNINGIESPSYPAKADA